MNKLNEFLLDISRMASLSENLLNINYYLSGNPEEKIKEDPVDFIKNDKIYRPNVKLSGMSLLIKNYFGQIKTYFNSLQNE